jgi:putative transposase
MLKYKSIRNGSNYAEVNENFTTQTCHGCGNRTGPKGVTGLNKREWVCDCCNLHLDRDVNSAINILKRGLRYQALAEGDALRKEA